MFFQVIVVYDGEMPFGVGERDMRGVGDGFSVAEFEEAPADLFFKGALDLVALPLDEVDGIDKAQLTLIGLRHFCKIEVGGLDFVEHGCQVLVECPQGKCHALLDQGRANTGDLAVAVIGEFVVHYTRPSGVIEPLKSGARTSSRSTGEA